MTRKIAAKIFQKTAQSNLLIKKEKTEFNTVFFPGCALSSTSPELVRKITDYLGDVNLFTGCCGNPAIQMKDLKSAKKIENKLVKHLGDYKRILVACPNCYQVTKRNFPNSEVAFVYEALNPKDFKLEGNYFMHHPCPIRDKETKNKIERFVVECGLNILDSKSYCCGAKNMMKMLDPEKFKKVNDHANDRLANPLTYCFECKENLKGSTHLLELLFHEKTSEISFFTRWANRFKVSR